MVFIRPRRSTAASTAGCEPPQPIEPAREGRLNPATFSFVGRQSPSRPDSLSARFGALARRSASPHQRAKGLAPLRHQDNRFNQSAERLKGLRTCVWALEREPGCRSLVIAVRKTGTRKNESLGIGILYAPSDSRGQTQEILGVLCVDHLGLGLERAVADAADASAI